MVKPGDMVQIVEEPWNIWSSDLVIVTKVDADEQGFDFVIPERRGHAPMKFAKFYMGGFSLEKLGVKNEGQSVEQLQLGSDKE